MERFRATIVKHITELDEGNKEQHKFLVTIDGAQQDEILSYAALLDIIERQLQEEMDDTERLWTFKEIVAHEGPLNDQHMECHG